MRLALGLAAALAFANPVGAQAAPPPALEEVQAEGVRQAVLAYLENFNAGNAEGVTAMFSGRPGVRFLEQGHVAYADRAAMQAAFTQLFKEIKGIRTEVKGDIGVLLADATAAVADFSWSVYVPDGKGGETELFSGISTLVFALEGEEWKIVAGHSSSSNARD